METITKEEVQKAISDFLDEKSGLTAAKKSFKKANEALAKEEENKNLDSAKIAKAEKNVETAQKKLHECQDTRRVKFANDVWIETKIKAAKNFKFGTHISKGVHSSSNGDCINFK